MPVTEPAVTEPARSEPAIPHRTPPHLAEPTITTVSGRDESFATAFMRGFHEPFRAEDFELEQSLVEPDRMFGHQVDGRWVSTCGSFARVMTTPGGSVPVAAVTVVTVSPGYRRRGLLREMMAHQLSAIRRRGDEPVALLWASESLIYGRFGYGRTTSRLRLSGRTRATDFLPGSTWATAPATRSVGTSSRRRRSACGSAGWPSARGS